MSVVLYEGLPTEIPCAGKVMRAPLRRNDDCPYRAESIGLPEETPVCSDHRWDFAHARDITELDVARAHCEACKGMAEGEAERRREERNERRAAKMRGHKLPRVREAGARWCPDHEDPEPEDVA
jgi:hypothetical protein